MKEHIKISEANRLASLDPVAAERAFELAVLTEDESGAASYYYGKFLHDQARYSEAIPVLQRAKIKSGPHAATSLLIAKCLFRLGESDRCRSELSEILERYPSHGGALKLLKAL